MASRHGRSAAAVTHFACAAHICDRSGPHVPVMSVFLSKAAALLKLKMGYSRTPSCFLSLCPHTVKFPQKPLGWTHNLSRTTTRDLERIIRNSQLTKMQAQKSSVTWDTPPSPTPHHPTPRNDHWRMEITSST